VLALLLNVGLDPIFIFGAGPIPAMGGGGAALATVIAEGVAAAVALWRLRRLGHFSGRRPADDEMRLDARTRLGARGLGPLDVAVFVRLARVGLPTLTTSLLFNFVLLEIMRIAESAGGAHAQAALGIGHTGETLAFVFGLGWAAAAASLVGRRLGSGRPDEAERAAWRAAHHCALLCFLWGAVLFALNETLAGLLTDDPSTRAHAAAYLRIVALCLAPQAYELVLDGAFGGAGMTVPPMLIATSISLLRIPLCAWAVDQGYGVSGIWIVISATAFVRGLLCMAWFARGTWKARSV
jgi:putative MATE family efflux protein